MGMQDNKIDWIVHYVGNGVPCDECGKVEDCFPEYICDAHTHGMNKYGHLEFQVVIAYGLQETGRLLNEMGFKVMCGERFKDGDRISGLYLDCDIIIKQTFDYYGKPILRLVIPDKENRLPTDSMPPFSYQDFDTRMLYIDKEKCS